MSREEQSSPSHAEFRDREKKLRSLLQLTASRDVHINCGVFDGGGGGGGDGGGGGGDSDGSDEGGKGVEREKKNREN